MGHLLRDCPVNDSFKADGDWASKESDSSHPKANASSTVVEPTHKEKGTEAAEQTAVPDEPVDVDVSTGFDSVWTGHSVVLDQRRAQFESMVNNLFLPLFVVSFGLRMKPLDIDWGDSDTLLKANVALVVVALVVKLIACFLPSYLSRMPTMDALALAFIMSTKGIIDMGMFTFFFDEAVCIFTFPLSTYIANQLVFIKDFRCILHIMCHESIS
ncbi:hypothetical protein ACOSQ3_002368 [Xanthoceras sorbifolium]